MHETVNEAQKGGYRKSALTALCPLAKNMSKETLIKGLIKLSPDKSD
jgi:hypothetical protein